MSNTILFRKHEENTTGILWIATLKKLINLWEMNKVNLVFVSSSLFLTSGSVFVGGFFGRRHPGNTRRTVEGTKIEIKH